MTRTFYGVCVVLLLASLAVAQSYTVTDLGVLSGDVSSEGRAISPGGQVVGELETNLQGFVWSPTQGMIGLPRLSGGRYSVAMGINATGLIAGYATYNSIESTHAVLWTYSGVQDLGTLGGIFSWGTGVNSAGDVAGYSTLSNGTYHAFLVHNGKMTDLGSLVANGSSEAYGINNFGEVVGWSTSVNGSGQSAFIYSGGKMTDLGTLGSDYTAASGINNSHQVVGGSDLANGFVHAFLYTNGRITDLGTLGGPQSSAYAINDVGQIVGWAQTKSDATHAFLYSGGKMIDLGAYNIDTVAEAINNSGVIVGQTYGVDASGSPFYHAFIYSSGKFQDLNKLIRPGSGFELTDATGINDTGQVVCDGYNTTNGQTHAFLLNRQ